MDANPTSGAWLPASRMTVRRNGGAKPVQQALGVLSLWIDRAQQRRCLGQLSDRSLKDIGVSRCDALHEARKPFWRR